MLNSRSLLAGVLVFLLSGCASFGPLGTADFEPTLRRDIPSIEGKAIYQTPATLLYGVDGYKLFSILAAESPIFSQGKFVSGEGIVVLTEQKLHFVRWVREKYEHVWDLEYKKVKAIEIRSLGLGRRLVIAFDGELGIASFDITLDGARIDAQRTTAVCQLIAQRSGKPCDLSP